MLTLARSTSRRIRKLAKQLERRRDALADGGGIDWGHAEALAFASLLVEGTRRPPQRAGRGARHVLAPPRGAARRRERARPYTPLQHLADGAAPFEIYNSPALRDGRARHSSTATAWPRRDALVLWEAQFGDFANVAQPIIDQFIAADRAKWGQDSGLVLLLPHGYEGQGPEHSSARLERFLQLCAEDNMRVAYPSTPAQYFHMLRRQARERAAPAARADAAEEPAATAARRRRGWRDLATRLVPAGDRRRRRGRRSAATVTRLVLCTGKIYYDLIAASAAAAATWRVVRVEELYPWPHDGARRDRSIATRTCEEVVWAQEEPKNMGAWSFVAPRLRGAVGNAMTDPLHRASRAREPGGGIRGDARGAAGAHRGGDPRAARRQARRHVPCNLRRPLSGTTPCRSPRDFARTLVAVSAHARAGRRHRPRSSRAALLGAQERGAAALGRRGRGAAVSVRVLVIGAHPDDEDTQLITWLAKGRHVETSRTSRSRAATAGRTSSATSSARRSASSAPRSCSRRGASTAGSSTSRARTTSASPRARRRRSSTGRTTRCSRDVVTVVRAFRPQVIISRVHRHAARRARAAPGGRDPRRARRTTPRATPCAFPRSATGGLAPWTPLKFYRARLYCGAPVPRCTTTPASTTRCSAGATPRSRARAARSTVAGLRRAAAQGTVAGLGAARGDRASTRRKDPTHERSIFDGIDTTYRRLRAELPAAERPRADSLVTALAALRAKFDPWRPSLVVPTLERVGRLARAIAPGCLARRGTRLRRAPPTRQRAPTALAAGVAVEATVDARRARRSATRCPPRHRVRSGQPRDHGRYSGRSAAARSPRGRCGAQARADDRTRQLGGVRGHGARHRGHGAVVAHAAAPRATCSRRRWRADECRAARREVHGAGRRLSGDGTVVHARSCSASPIPRAARRAAARRGARDLAHARRAGGVRARQHAGRPRAPRHAALGDERRATCPCARAAEGPQRGQRVAHGRARRRSASRTRWSSTCAARSPPAVT